MKTILLDLGNVLIFHDNALLVRNLASAAGRDEDEIATLFDPQLHDRINRGAMDEEAIKRYLRDTMDVSGSNDDLEALWSSHFDVYDEVVPIVESLLGKVKVGLVSNTNALHARYCKQQMPILKRLDTLVLSHEIGFAKPDRRIFQEALRRLDTKPEDAAFFDDVQLFVDAATELGIQGRLFTTAEQFANDLKDLGIR